MSSQLILSFLQYSPFTIRLGQPFSLWHNFIRFMQYYSSRSTLIECSTP
jgi:hypothetical protein